MNRWGFVVFEAASGEEALSICEKHHIDLVLSDWMMPGMNGLEFCAAFRKLERESYGYFILLTSKSEKTEVAQGLDVGADDFLTKPVNISELKARIAAGTRILEMQWELTQKNALISETLAELQAMNRALDRDLVEAKKLQQSLVPERVRDFGAAEVSLLLRPSGHVGGDLVGVFPINDCAVGIFALDVSGHGIASALMTARLAGFFSGASPAQNVALQKRANGTFEGRAPSEIASRLNTLALDQMDTEHYFTLVYAELDLGNGQVRLVQAGQPSPMVQRANGQIETIGEGGLPVGLIPGAVFEDLKVKLSPGDRLLLFSDGFTECPNSVGLMLDDDGLARLLEKNSGHARDVVSRKSGLGSR